MPKILQATSRGQVTLPKQWRDKFDTKYFQVEISDNAITLKPLLKNDFASSVEESYLEYEKGDYVTHEDLIKEYDL